MIKFLSSEYQLYACGKNYSHALILNQNHDFLEEGSSYCANNVLSIMDNLLSRMMY